MHWYLHCLLQGITVQVREGAVSPVLGLFFGAVAASVGMPVNIQTVGCQICHVDQKQETISFQEHGHFSS